MSQTASERGRASSNRLSRPIFIIGCNRSGTTLLFNNLSYHPLTWSLYVEAQDVFHRHYPVDPEKGELVNEPPTTAVAEAIRHELYARSHNKEFFKDTPLLSSTPRKLLQRPLGRLYKPYSIRLVEKTPANSLRIPLLHSMFPDAKFLFLVRRGEDVVSSLMEGWKNWSNTVDNSWHYTKWHYLVPPRWQRFREKSLQEICAFQWAEATLTAWKDLNRLASRDFLLLKHEDLMAAPAEGYCRILEFCELPASRYLEKLLSAMPNRVYTTGGSSPRPQKWMQLHRAEIESVLHTIAPVNALFYE